MMQAGAWSLTVFRALIAPIALNWRFLWTLLVVLGRSNLSRVETRLSHLDDLVYQTDYRSFDRYLCLFFRAGHSASDPASRYLGPTPHLVGESLGSFSFLRAAALLSAWSGFATCGFGAHPETFCALCARPAITLDRHAGRCLTVPFLRLRKILQCAVFLAWCFAYGKWIALAAQRRSAVLTLGAALLIGSQVLNHRLACSIGSVGKVGVFNMAISSATQRLWVLCRGFPPHVFGTSPSVAGALLSITGCFLVMRSPQGRLVYPARARNAVLRSRRVLGPIIGNLRDPVQWAPLPRLLSASICQACKSVHESQARSSRARRMTGLEGIQIIAIVLKKPRTIGFEQFIRVMQILRKFSKASLQYGQHEIALWKRMFVASNCTPKNSALYVVAFRH